MLLQEYGITKRTIIVSSNDEDLKYWSAKFGTTIDDLCYAIDAVGNKIADVEEYLKSLGLISIQVPTS